MLLLAQCLPPGLRLGVPLGFAMVAITAPAAAQQSAVDQARSLAQDAAEQLEQGKFAEALDAASKAEGLYHAAIHLSIIGQSLEGLGRLAEAADTYERLAAEQLPATAAPVFKKAQETGNERLRALLARVPSLLVKVRVPGGPGADGDVTVTVDGKPFEVRAVATRLDPGKRTIRAEAPGHAPVVREIDLPEKGGVVVVDIELRPEGAPAQPPPEKPAEAEPAAEPGSIVPAVVAFSIGGVGLGVGAVTGAIFLSQMGDLHDRCPEDRCDAAAQGDIDSAGTMGNVSTIGFGVGIAGAAVGVVLLALRSDGGASTSASTPARAPGSVALTPFASSDTLGVRGSF